VRFALLFALAASVHAGVVSQEWMEGTLSLKLDDGAAQIEWIGPRAFRVVRSWGSAEVTEGARIAHPHVDVRREELRMVSRYLTVDVDRDSGLVVWNGANQIATVGISRSSRGAEVAFAPMSRVYGLRGGGRGNLNLHSEKLARGRGFFFTSDGYGVFMVAPALCAFDFDKGAVEAQGAEEIEFVFYYGPTPKEILEQHTLVTGRVGGAVEDRVVDGWNGIEDLVRGLNELSLSAVLNAAVRVEVAERAPKEVRRRVADLAALVPGLRDEDSGDRSLQVSLKPYLDTYRQEALDRGYPLVRPLLMEYPRDAGMDARADLFMLGDELLVAPVISESDMRRVDLPRGSWTDLRTNVEYQGRRVVDVMAEADGGVPVFARNGAIVPMVKPGVMELHYFPSAAGEFFLYEVELNDNSQFHAAPAGDEFRVEIESKVARTYEWVLHHMDAPTQVAEETGVYVREETREKLRSGSWWFDEERGDLHIMIRAEAGSDVVVNLKF
jgi:hypothetical protein